MADPALGSIENVNPRDVWPNEASDFTPWLAKHVDVLAAALGLDIEIAQSEAAVGAFSLDLLGKESGSDRVVIIENQLERTDHAHLGQLLAYAAGLDARIVVWISPDVRDEHREAVHWLNEHTTDSAAFFAVELEVWRIGDSLPAPRFNVVARPSGFQRQIARGTTAPSERGIAYREFLRDLVRRLHAEKPGFTRADPDLVRYESWTVFGAGRSGFSIEAAFASEDRFRVGLTINTRAGDSTRNKAAFDALYAQREAVERELGVALEWERLDEWVMSRVAAYRTGSIDSPQEVLDELTDWAVDLLPRFRDAFAPRVADLDLDVLSSLATTDEAAP